MKKRGFIALMSVIILSAVLLGMAATASTAGFFARFSVLDKEYKKTALGLADSCANVALLNLAQNYAYAPVLPLTVQLDTGTCTIHSITTIGTLSASSRTVLIITSAKYQEAFSTVEVNATIANPANTSVAIYPITNNSWRETN
jgi:hypothetical protein